MFQFLILKKTGNNDLNMNLAFNAFQLGKNDNTQISMITLLLRIQVTNFYIKKNNILEEIFIGEGAPPIQYVKASIFSLFHTSNAHERS